MKFGGATWDISIWLFPDSNLIKSEEIKCQKATEIANPLEHEKLANF